MVSRLWKPGLLFVCAGACASDPQGEEAAGDEVGATDETETETGEESGSEAGEGGSETGTEDTGEALCDPGMPQRIEHEFLPAGASAQDVALDACSEHLWWVSAAEGVELTVAIAASSDVEIAISYPDAPSFVDFLARDTFIEQGALEFDSPRSGEFAVLVRPLNPAQDPELSLEYDLSVACTNDCGRETTRFPLVMVHGWTGFENIGPLTYFYNVREDLEGLGYPVAIAVLDPYNAVEVRGEQLVDFVDVTLTNWRARKVDLIGHSQGGIDSRYVAAEAGGGRGDRIGAVITVGTPHQGTPFTDIALGLLPGPAEQSLVFLLNFLGAAQSQQSDVEASLYTLSETFMQEEFNQIYVDDPRVEYRSWMGETCIGGIGCQDVLDPLLVFSYETIYPLAGPNDGLVPEESAKWGTYLGVVPADHIDEIGQVAGVTSLAYDHVAFFRDNARMLRDDAF
jgi:triacylglycerol esterase/lipase EstA (alpha/beta hydrolase family)